MFAHTSLLILITTLAYFIGSIPFGLIFTRMTGHGDIRHIGSGNIGATNVLRTGSHLLAALTLICDAGKGVFVVIVVKNITDPQTAVFAGLLVVIGHCFPIWLKFSGGKGVATSLAVFSTLDLRFGAIFVVVWSFTALISRYSSLAALCGILAVVISGFLMLQDQFTQIMLLLLGGLVWTRHHENIIRLLSGAETKIGDKID